MPAASLPHRLARRVRRELAGLCRTTVRQVGGDAVRVSSWHGGTRTALCHTAPGGDGAVPLPTVTAVVATKRAEHPDTLLGYLARPDLSGARGGDRAARLRPAGGDPAARDRPPRPGAHVPA
ncbi:MAG TPA: hypothetical protein VFA46_09430 [Actinomycetes bacterium]|nr:hypothetical protein [Actinomycetes bacterium]